MDLHRISALVGIPRLLGEFGLIVDAILPGLPLERSAFDDADGLIPFEVACCLLDRCVEATGCGHFALLLGAAADPLALGHTWQRMGDERTLGGALSCLQSMHPHVWPGAAVRCLVLDDSVDVRCGVYAPRAPGWHHNYPMVLAQIHQAIEALAGGAARPTDVFLTLPEPADRKPWMNILGASLHFNQPFSGLSYSRSAMNLPVANTGRTARNLPARGADSSFPEVASTWSSRVRRSLRLQLLDASHAQTAVAGQLGVPSRTLRRHLACEGTTFDALLGDVRLEVACELLALTNLPVSDVAHAVGYATHSSFSNAFRRRAGTTAQLWRTKHSGQLFVR